jgi:uncharacterized protein
MNAQPAPASAAPTLPDGRAYVGLGRRALAALIDNATWLIFGLMVASFIPIGSDGDLLISEEAAGAILFVFATAWFNYFSLAEWRWGQTMGKNATGIEVVSLDGSPISFGQASVRNLLRLVDFFVIGWVLLAGGGRRQRLGDMAAKTVVVRRPPKKIPERPGVPAQRPAAATAAAPGPAPSGAPVTPETETGDGEGKPGFGWVTWKPSDVLMGIIAAAIVSTLATLILVLPFDPSLETTEGQLVGQIGLWGTLVGVALAGATGWRFEEWREALRKLGFRDFRCSHLKLAGGIVGSYLLFAIVVGGLLDVLFGYRPDQEELSETLDVDLTPLTVIVLYLSACLMAPVTEETFFRGFVFAGLRKRWGFWVGAVVSALIFGVVHAGTGPAAIPFLAVLGGAFAYAYERSGSLWPAVFAHAINNLLAITFQVTT